MEYCMRSVAATMDEEPGILQHRIFPEKENFEGGSSVAGQMSSWQLCQWPCQQMAHRAYLKISGGRVNIVHLSYAVITCSRSLFC